MTLTVGSLFAGVGGFDIAAERAGMEVAWQSEVDRNASKVLEHHWPGMNLGDIHGITQPTGVDVLCGGFPCQDYSVAGNREGLAGDRGALWWEYHRLIAAIRPDWVVAENVPGLLSSRDGQDFATIIDSLTELGYGVVWAVLDAQYFGVAQRRRRVFIVGHAGGRPRPEILALSEGVHGHPQPSRETWEGVAATIETCPTDARRRAEVGHLILDDDRSGGPSMDEPVTPTLAARMRTGGNNMPMVFRQQRTTDYVKDDIASTVAARDYKDATDLVTGSTVRRLTPLECERLQGFPDEWTDIPGASDSARYKQMGNAVAVPVVEWIMRRIAEGEAE